MKLFIIMKTITIGENIFQIDHSCHLKPIILSIFFCLFSFFVLFLEEEGFLSVKMDIPHEFPLLAYFCRFQPNGSR